MDAWATSARIFSLVRGKDPLQSKRAGQSTSQCSGKENLLELFYMLFISDIPCKSHSSWSCQEARGEPFLPSKMFLKLAAQRCQLHSRCVLKFWWGSEKLLWKWHLVIAHTWFVGKSHPKSHLPGWLTKTDQPWGVRACREPMLVGLPCPSAPDA